MSNTEKEKELSEATEEVLVEESNVDGDSSESLEELDLVSQIEKLTQEKEALFQRLLVSEADMKNLRRRTELDLANAHKFALEKFVKELLPCLDAVEAEINELNKKESLSDELVKFKEGSELTYRMLLNAVEKFGVKQISPIGEVLNPDLHQAIAVVPMQDKESNEIIDVTQKGYTLNDRLVRAALVVVAQ
ncbi:nucleotide exchange factor GrpE [Wohlfahrtiimonas larvae]|uniref:Protein GrpE n=1 Tax=Wohlfahrtiimonas larvae TaxID=1157986 RepID=A0ABP9MHP0_9GAMM|nr:nucleotide exchange factor GrpE [Wohlfahrtiimonas larvae]